VQTRAFAERDVPTLRKASAIPMLALCALLLSAGDRLFALLLGHAATVPPTTTPILVVLLLANLAQNIASSLLLHTGFFREIARVARFLVVAMAAMPGVVLAMGLDVVGLIGGYAAVYVAGAGLYIIYVLCEPFRVAAAPKV
jgi:hypothetical protein